MSSAMRLILMGAVVLHPALARGEACGFVDAPTSMTASLRQMSSQLKTILDSAPRDANDRPECRTLAEQMSTLAVTPALYSDEQEGKPSEQQALAQQKMLELSGQFFQKRCDRWIGENGTKSIATTTLGIARSFLSATALVPGFQLPVLAVGTLTDLVFGALERLFQSRSINDQLADHEKLLDQQALLCAYFEHVTQVDESLTDDVLDRRRRLAQDQVFTQKDKIRDLEMRINACALPVSSPIGTSGFIWEDWKRIRGKLEGENEAERYFSLLDRIQSAEWNGEIAHALKRVCSPDETPNPTEQQKAVCAYHRKLIDLLASPERDQTAILKAYENLLAGISAARVFNATVATGATELETLQAQLSAERALLEKLELDAQGLSDNDEILRSGIFDRIRLRGGEMLIGTSSKKGVLRSHIEILQESIRRNIDQIPVSDLLRRLENRNSRITCDEIRSIRQPLQAVTSHVRLIERVCTRFAGDLRPSFRDKSLSFSQADPRLESHCVEEVKKANERREKTAELEIKLQNDPRTEDCTRNWR